VRPIEEHLRNKDARVREAFERLQRAVGRFGGVSLDPIKTAVQFRAGATFLSVRAKRDHLVLEFQLEREFKDYPVYETVRISGNRFLHRAVIEDARELDARLLGLLREACILVRGS